MTESETRRTGIGGRSVRVGVGDALVRQLYSRIIAPRHAPAPRVPVCRRQRGGAEDSISAAVFSEVLLARARARDTVRVKVGVRVGVRLTLALSRTRCSRPWGA